MAKIQNLSEISPEIRFTEYDFYDFYTKTFRMTELGRMHSLIPFKQLVEDFGLRRHGRHMCGRKPFFTPEGKIALAFFDDVHQAIRTDADGATQRQHPLPDILWHPDSSGEAPDGLQDHRQGNVGAGLPSEDTDSSDYACRSMEALHEGPRHTSHRRHLLREPHALSHGCQAAVGVHREGLCHHVRDEPGARHPPSQDQVPRRGKGKYGLCEAAPP